MKYIVSALIATAAFAQFDPTDCCKEIPVMAFCVGCTPMQYAARKDDTNPTSCCSEVPLSKECLGCPEEVADIP